MFTQLLAKLSSAFSEANGKASSTRILGGTVVLSTILWVSYLVMTTKALPDLTSAALFVGAGFSGYGANKISDAFSKKV